MKAPTPARSKIPDEASGISSPTSSVLLKASWGPRFRWYGDLAGRGEGGDARTGGVVGAGGLGLVLEGGEEAANHCLCLAGRCTGEAEDDELLPLRNLCGLFLRCSSTSFLFLSFSLLLASTSTSLSNTDISRSLTSSIRLSTLTSSSSASSGATSSSELSSSLLPGQSSLIW